MQIDTPLTFFFSKFQISNFKMVDAFLGKKYKLASSENFDEFMKELGKLINKYTTLKIVKIIL